MFSNDFLSVNEGLIEKHLGGKILEKLTVYFKGVEFVKWAYNEERIVRFSDDGSTAYVAVDKMVIVKLPGKIGGTTLDNTKFAWLTVYKKKNANGRWTVSLLPISKKK